MERLLRPAKFSTLHSEVDAEKKWKYWRKTFENFVTSIPEPAEGAPPINKLALLINLVDPDVFDYISDKTIYEDALDTLNRLYEKPVNIIHARHLLATRKQDPSETLDCYLQVLRGLAKHCHFVLPESALLYEEEYIRDAFISGLTQQSIRERLLEENTLTLGKAFEIARSKEVAQKHSQSYGNQLVINAVQNSEIPSEISSVSPSSRPVSPEEQGKAFEFPGASLNAISKEQSCGFCGNWKHERSVCPARNTTCYKCGKPGHFGKVCRSNKQGKRSNQNQNISSAATLCTNQPNLCTLSLASAPDSLSKTVVNVVLNGKHQLHCLIDTGSSNSFISQDVVKRYNIQNTLGQNQYVCLAAGKSTTPVIGECLACLEMLNHKFENVSLKIIKSLCSDIILGLDIMKQLNTLHFNFGGKGADLVVNSSDVCLYAVGFLQ